MTQTALSLSLSLSAVSGYHLSRSLHISPYVSPYLSVCADVLVQEEVWPLMEERADKVEEGVDVAYHLSAYVVANVLQRPP